MNLNIDQVNQQSSQNCDNIKVDKGNESQEKPAKRYQSTHINRKLRVSDKNDKINNNNNTIQIEKNQRENSDLEMGYSMRKLKETQKGLHKEIEHQKQVNLEQLKLNEKQKEKEKEGEMVKNMDFDTISVRSSISTQKIQEMQKIYKITKEKVLNNPSRFRSQANIYASLKQQSNNNNQNQNSQFYDNNNINKNNNYYNNDDDKNNNNQGLFLSQCFSKLKQKKMEQSCSLRQIKQKIRATDQIVFGKKSLNLSQNEGSNIFQNKRYQSQADITKTENDLESQQDFGAYCKKVEEIISNGYDEKDIGYYGQRNGKRSQVSIFNKNRNKNGEQNSKKCIKLPPLQQQKEEILTENDIQNDQNLGQNNLVNENQQIEDESLNSDQKENNGEANDEYQEGDQQVEKNENIYESYNNQKKQLVKNYFEEKVKLIDLDKQYLEREGKGLCLSSINNGQLKREILRKNASILLTQANLKDIENIIQPFLPENIFKNPYFSLNDFINDNSEYVLHLLGDCPCRICKCGACKCPSNARLRNPNQFKSQYTKNFQNIQDNNSNNNKSSVLKNPGYINSQEVEDIYGNSRNILAKSQEVKSLKENQNQRYLNPFFSSTYSKDYIQKNLILERAKAPQKEYGGGLAKLSSYNANFIDFQWYPNRKVENFKKNSFLPKLKGEMGGIYFNSSYLKSYSIDQQIKVIQDSQLRERTKLTILPLKKENLVHQSTKNFQDQRMIDMCKKYKEDFIDENENQIQSQLIKNQSGSDESLQSKEKINLIAGKDQNQIIANKSQDFGQIQQKNQQKLELKQGMVEA